MKMKFINSNFFKLKKIIWLLFVLFIFLFSFKYKNYFFEKISFIKEKFFSCNTEFNGYYNLVNDLDKNLLIENKELLKLNSISFDNYNVIISKVIFRNIDYWNNSLIINKGSLDNVLVGDTVYSLGLVGKVVKSFNNYSIVSLITNNNMQNFGIKINSYVGKISSYNNGLFVVNVNNDIDIKIGDLVYTLGYGVYESGLSIGKVSFIEKNKDGIGSTIYINPNNDFNNINYVLVIK